MKKKRHHKKGHKRKAIKRRYKKIRPRHHKRKIHNKRIVKKIVMRRTGIQRAPPITINMPPMPMSMRPRKRTRHKRKIVRRGRYAPRQKYQQLTPQPSTQPAVQKNLEVDRLLIENFVSLQKVMTNLSVKLDDLTTKISKLLELFEISAKALAEKEFEVERDNKEMVERLDNLLDQNKTLARGMALMHERIPRDYTPPQINYVMPPNQQMAFSMPLPPAPVQRPLTQEITPESESPEPSPFNPPKPSFEYPE